MPPKKTPKRVTRYTHDDAHDPATPETGHTALLPGDEQFVELDMNNGWVGGLKVGKLDDGRTVVVDIDPAIDPILMWAGKRSRRHIPVLPLQRNEVVSESRIAQIIVRARETAASGKGRQGSLFADLEKELRESEKGKRVEFYTHGEGWKNKLICGDSLPVMESLLRYEGLAGRVQMIYVDPPYGISYDSNFQQRLDQKANRLADTADDVLTIRAFRDTWALGVHSYLAHLRDRLYLCRELLTESGSLFLQIGDDNVHLTRCLLDEVFGRENFISQVSIRKTAGKSSGMLDAVFDYVLWYAKDRSQCAPRYNELFVERTQDLLDSQFKWVETPNGRHARLSPAQLDGLEPIPEGRRFVDSDLTSQGESSNSFEIEYEGRRYQAPEGRHWTTGQDGIERLKALDRLIAVGNWLKYKRYADDFPYSTLSNQWQDTVFSTFSREKIFVVQTHSRVVERCLLMSTRPGDLVFDPTCGSGTSAFVAEMWGRRWITCDTSRVAINGARHRLLGASFPYFKMQGASPSSGFLYETAERTRLKSLAYDLESEKVELVDRPEEDAEAIRVAGPFEVVTVGRYALEDWRGYVGTTLPGEHTEARLEDYVEVVSRLYQTHAEPSAGTGLVHALAETEGTRIGISVGPLTGRVTARQVNDAVADAISLGVAEVHILGWAFEANVGEVKTELEQARDVAIQLVMIRPDALAEGLKVTKPSELFSPLALPEIDLRVQKVKGAKESVFLVLKGVGLFNRATRKTAYHKAESGYIAAWYLDEDYDGDCFVDCQMFFDFKKAPNLTQVVGHKVDAEEFELKFEAEPFEPGKYRRVAVKVVDVYGNESTVVRSL